MKIRYSILFFLLVAVSFNACDKAQTPVFEMDMFFDIDIPPGLNTLETHFFIIEDVPTFATSLLAAQNLGPDDIGNIRGAISTVNSRFSGLNLDFIEDVGVHLVEKDDHNIRSEAFYIFNDFIPLATKSEIEMIPTILDLKDLLLEETVDLEFRINFRSFIPQTFDGRIQMKFLAYRPE